MPLNPAIARVLQMIAKVERLPFHAMTPAEARAAYETSATILDLPPTPVAEVETLRIPVRDGAAIEARLYRPRPASWFDPAPALVFFHGGGFTVGSLDTHDALARVLAARADCVVCAVAYRLAPEHKFPTASDDAFDALAWVAAHAAALGLDEGRIAVGGDSSGGTLAAVCAVLARDAELPLCLQLLIYPGTEGFQRHASHRRYGEGYLLSEKTVQWFFGHYVRDAGDREDWRFAPLDGTRGAPADFSGLAPAWIGLAEYDPLVDEGVAYARKLARAGNAVTLKVYPGMIHEFIKMARFVPEAARAHDDAVAALQAAFAVPVQAASGSG